MTQDSLAAISYEVEALDGPAQIVVQSELVANEELPLPEKDPRAAMPPDGPLLEEQSHAEGTSGYLVHRTERSGLRIAAAMDHEFDEERDLALSIARETDEVRFTAATSLEQGESFRILKFIAYGCSAERSSVALADEVVGVITAARQTGWDGLLKAQRSFLDEFWDHGDIEVEGDPAIQQAVRFSLFHILQTTARADGNAIPAKGLTGNGYDGHSFWDTESFVIPVLLWTTPESAARLLRWRHATLPAARRRARQLNLAGATFPWRTINGEECSGYWPAGTAAFHINASVGDAVRRYVDATGDDEFSAGEGLELLIETARLWRSLGHHDAAGRFRIDGVTGPDEYSAVTDNNIYTNLMAARNLIGAADAAERHPRHAWEFGVDEEEMAAWRDAAAAIHLPFDDDLGIHAQSDGFTLHEVWDFEGMRADQYPLMLHFAYFDLYRKQVVKQADLVLAMHLCGDAFTAEQKARNFAYYEQLTVRDSSLSACTQSVMAAEVGHLDLAYDYLVECALMDLGDLEHNTRDGLHIASIAGTWIALVAGFAGMRDHTGSLTFRPQLPERITALRFTLVVRGGRLTVEIDPSTTRYAYQGPEELCFSHYDESVTLMDGESISLPVTRTRAGPAPSQPARRGPGQNLRRPEPVPRRRATDVAGTASYPEPR